MDKIRELLLEGKKIASDNWDDPSEFIEFDKSMMCIIDEQGKIINFSELYTDDFKEGNYTIIGDKNNS